MRGEENMEEVLDKIKTQAGKAKDGAVKITKTVIDKTNNVVNQTKLRFALGETNNKITDVYAEIGKDIYKAYRSGMDLASDETQAKCEKIDSLREELAELKAQLAELRDCVECPRCGEYNNTEHKYCSKCGEKLTDDEIIDDDDRVATINIKKPDGEE